MLNNTVFKPHTASMTGIKSNFPSIYIHATKVYTEAWQITHLYNGSKVQFSFESWNVYSSAFPNLYKTMFRQKSTFTPRHINEIITTVSNIFFYFKNPASFFRNSRDSPQMTQSMVALYRGLFIFIIVVHIALSYLVQQYPFRIPIRKLSFHYCSTEILYIASQFIAERI